MKLPGLKGEWARPDSIAVNEAGVPTYWWTFNAGEVMANETNADRRSRQRDALKGQLHGLVADADARKHLAEEVREAAHSDPATHRRVIEVFERLGVAWPQGFKP